MSAGVPDFVECLLKSFQETANVEEQQCNYHAASGQLVVVRESKTRVVPVATLFLHYARCSDATARDALVAAVTEAFVKGTADVPDDYQSCGGRLLPQLWAKEKIVARESTLPEGHNLPHCGIHGEERPLPSHDFGVVLVCEYESADGALPAIETPVLSSDLVRWQLTFVETMDRALANLRTRTKDGLPANKRWDHHPTGCATSGWQDRFDAARAVLLPKLTVQRKRQDGQPESGGHVAVCATTSCVLATTSKNPLGLCFMGDTLHLKIGADHVNKNANQLLSTVPYRLLKAKDDRKTQHPLNQKASEGFVWRWMPYAPGAPPLRAEGEFSVPIDQGEVDAILDAAEAGKSVPVFHHAGEPPSEFSERKEKANGFFKAGEYLKSIVAYDITLKSTPAPSNADAAIVHANAAQALLKLAELDATKREGCAGEAMKRAILAIELDNTYGKAHARCAAACEMLGEHAAAAEAREKADSCAAVRASADAAAKAAKFAAGKTDRDARDAFRNSAKKGLDQEAHRAALLERERAKENDREKERQEDELAAKLNKMVGVDPSLADFTGRIVGGC